MNLLNYILMSSGLIINIAYDFEWVDVAQSQAAEGKLYENMSVK